MIFKKNHSANKSLSDEQLMLRLQNGEVAAFDQLYERYNQRLMYYFYRMLGANKELAEDFLQETFYKLINKPELFDTQKSFSTWIFSMAHNLCKNEYRSRSVRAIVVEEENPDKHFSEGREESSSPNIGLIFKTLEQFDETHKTVFLLKYREGFSIDEISEIMNIPKGTVKSRIHYTKQQLRKELAHVYQNF